MWKTLENWTKCRLLPEILIRAVLKAGVDLLLVPGCANDLYRTCDLDDLEKSGGRLAEDDLVFLVELVFEVPATDQGEEQSAEYADVGCRHVIGEGGIDCELSIVEIGDVESAEEA